MILPITNRLSIPDEELRFTYSRSGGPGGQNVNKVNTRVTLWFDVAGSPALSPEEKDLILHKLATRINREGVLRIVSQKTRSQKANQELATERFTELLKGALEKAPPRKRTQISRSARERRLEEKKRQSRIKRIRGKVVAEED